MWASRMYCYVPHETTLSVNGGFTVGGPLAVNAILSPTTYQLGDDLSLVRGAHQLAFGWTQYQYRSTTIGGVNSQGTFSFNGAGTGNGMADFLLGKVGTLTQGGPNTLFTRKNFVALYAQEHLEGNSKADGELWSSMGTVPSSDHDE